MHLHSQGDATMPKRMPAYTVIVNVWGIHESNKGQHIARTVKNFNDSDRAESYAQRNTDNGFDVELVNNAVHKDWQAWNMTSFTTVR